MSAPSPSPGEAGHFPPIGTAVEFRPRTGTMQEWNAAYVRVEDYLRAHRIHNRLHQSRLIQQILDLRGAQLRVSNIAVEVEHAEGGARIVGDAHQLQQVFLNLMLNAEQAILGSGVGSAIRVQTQTRRDGERERVVVQVIDNGPGIDADVLPHVFDPFFTTKPVGQGTGLGLSVSYGIVQQHGGELTVESRPGRTRMPSRSARRRLARMTFGISSAGLRM